MQFYAEKTWLYRFEIQEDETEGFCIYIYSEETKFPAWDYVQDTLEIAKSFAQKQFGVSADSWNPNLSAKKKLSFRFLLAEDPKGMPQVKTFLGNETEPRLIDSFHSFDEAKISFENKGCVFKNDWKSVGDRLPENIMP